MLPLAPKAIPGGGTAFLGYRGGQALLPFPERRPRSVQAAAAEGGLPAMRLSPCGCCAIVISIIGLALAIAGHIIYAMRVPTGELPLWYTLQTCRQSKDVAIGPRNFDLYPLAPTGSSSECAQPYNPASAATRIMIDESDGVRKGVRPPLSLGPWLCSCPPMYLPHPVAPLPLRHTSTYPPVSQAARACLEYRAKKAGSAREPSLTLPGSLQPHLASSPLTSLRPASPPRRNTTPASSSSPIRTPQSPSASRTAPATSSCPPPIWS